MVNDFHQYQNSPVRTYITYQLLEDVFEKGSIRTTRRPVYNNLKSGIDPYIYPEEDYDYPVAEDENEDYSEEYLDSVYYINPTYWYHNLKNIPDTTSYLFINRTFDVDDLDLEYLLDFVGLGNNVFISAEDYSRKFTDTLGIKTSMNYNRDDSIFVLSEHPEKKYPFKTVYGTTRFNVDSCKHPVRCWLQPKPRMTLYL